MVGKKLNIVRISKQLDSSLIITCQLKKPIKLHLLTIIIRCVFSEDSKFYPQLLLDDALYELV